MVDLDVTIAIFYTYCAMLDSRVLLLEGHNLNKYGKIIHIIMHHVTSLTFIVEWIHALLAF